MSICNNCKIFKVCKSYNKYNKITQKDCSSYQPEIQITKEQAIRMVMSNEHLEINNYDKFIEFWEEEGYIIQEEQVKEKDTIHNRAKKLYGEQEEKTALEKAELFIKELEGYAKEGLSFNLTNIYCLADYYRQAIKELEENNWGYKRK